MQPAHLAIVSSAWLLIGCGDQQGLPTNYETEHLRIGTDLGHPLCAGDLVAYESIVLRVEDELGVSMNSRFDVSIWSDDAWPAIAADYCSDGVLGCTDYSEGAIYTSLSAISHELVHAATPYPYLTPFFAEGLADVYAGEMSRFGHTAPADSLHLSSTEMDRWSARHFIRWMRETWGVTKLGELVSLGEHADDRFLEVYGLSFADAQARFFAEAPFGYQGLDTCEGAPLESVNDLGGWRAVVGLDCAVDEDVRAIGLGVITYRTFEIPVAGHYSVSTDAYALVLSRCATGPIEDAIRSEDYFDHDVPPSYSGDITENFATYEGGAILDLYFEPGMHQIGLFLMGYEASEASLAIWPTLGPQPVGGGN